MYLSVCKDELQNPVGLDFPKQWWSQRHQSWFGSKRFPRVPLDQIKFDSNTVYCEEKHLFFKPLPLPLFQFGFYFAARLSIERRDDLRYKLGDEKVVNRDDRQKQNTQNERLTSIVVRAFCWALRCAAAGIVRRACDGPLEPTPWMRSSASWHTASFFLMVACTQNIRSKTIHLPVLTTIYRNYKESYRELDTSGWHANIYQLFSSNLGKKFILKYNFFFIMFIADVKRFDIFMNQGLDINILKNIIIIIKHMFRIVSRVKC